MVLDTPLYGFLSVRTLIMVPQKCQYWLELGSVSKDQPSKYITLLIKGDGRRESEGGRDSYATLQYKMFLSVTGLSGRIHWGLKVTVAGRSLFTTYLYQERIFPCRRCSSLLMSYSPVKKCNFGDGLCAEAVVQKIRQFLYESYVNPRKLCVAPWDVAFARV